MAEMETIKQNVIEVSQTFYNTQDKEQRRVAEDWLNDFKKSLNAWTVADQLLHTDRSEQVLFFAAQTIRTKIQFSFHELPKDFHQVIILSVSQSISRERKSSQSTIGQQSFHPSFFIVLVLNELDRNNLLLLVFFFANI